MISNYDIGDIVEMKKIHPCGSYNWQIIRVGADIKIKCMGCSRLIMLSRRDFEKAAKKIVAENKNMVDINK